MKKLNIKHVVEPEPPKGKRADQPDDDKNTGDKNSPNTSQQEGMQNLQAKK